ncbi:MAG: hypothetical protein Q4G21_07580 [Dermabacter sp.]|nr:hypothetical protein [Dermabacter sp.]
MRAYRVQHSERGDAPRGLVNVDAGSLVWGVDARQRAGRSNDEVEEREFEALVQCLLVAAQAPGAQGRLVCVAIDVPDTALAAADLPADEVGEYAHQLTKAFAAKPAAWLVSESSAPELLADEWAPEVLWFDASEEADAWACAADNTAR